MNLLIITNLFPTPADHERGIFTLQLVKRLQKHANVTVVCPLPWFPKINFLNNIKVFNKWSTFSNVPLKYIIDGVEVHSPKYILLPKISENIHDKLMMAGIIRYVRKLHKNIHFDAVNSQWLYPDSVAAGKITKKLQIPHIPTGLGCDVNLDIYQPVKGNKILDMLHHSRAITVVSNGLKEELIKNNIENNKITVIPNGIDIDKFKILNKDECRKNLNIPKEQSVILYVGRLSEEKNVSTLIKAASKLIKTNQTLHVYLVGDGPLRSELELLANKLGTLKNIHFIGKIVHDLVGTWMGATDYFCLPSLREGCPNVILESLGCGRPVIASNVGAIPDIVTNESGILFTPEDVTGLTNALSTALRTNWNEEIINKSVKNLSWENAAKKYTNVFISAI